MAPTSQGGWICEDTELHLCDLFDGTLAPATQAELDRHVASCAQCATMLAGVGGLVHHFQTLEPVPEPPQLASAILDATIGARRGKSLWTMGMDWLKPIAQPGFVYGAVSLLVTAIVLSQALGIQWSDAGLSDLNPVTLVHAANRRAHQAYAHSAKLVNDLRLVYEVEVRLHPEEEPEQVEQTPVDAPGGALDDGFREPRKFRESEKLLNISNRAAHHREQGSTPAHLPADRSL